MEDETASFSAYFDRRSRRTAAGSSEPGATLVQEVVLPLHDESLQLLTELALSEGVTGSTEHMRSVALQLSLDRFTRYCRERGMVVPGELHLSAGEIKDRYLCLFSDTLDELGNLERDLHCSETILLESAILHAAGRTGLGVSAPAAFAGQ